MTKLPVLFSIIGLSLALTASFNHPPDPASKLGIIEQGAVPLDTPRYSLIGEWELAVSRGRSRPKLIFDPLQVHIDGLAHRYTLDGDSLRIFTEYVDHIGDGNSHGYISKLTKDSLMVNWREGDVNTYVRSRKPLK